MGSQNHPLRLKLQLFDLLRTPVWIFDVEKNQFWWANQAALDLWGCKDLAALQERGLNSSLSPAVRMRLQDYLLRLKSGGTVTEQWTLYPRDEPKSLRCLCSGVMIEGERVAMLVEAMPESSSDHGALRALEAFRHLPVPVSLYDENGHLILRNPVARHIFNTSDTQFLLHFAYPEEAVRAQQLFESGEGGHCEAQVFTVTGQRWHDLECRRARDPGSGKEMVVVVERDITDRKLAEQRESASLLCDPLTGLPNCLLLEDRLNSAITQANRKGEHVAVVALDLRGFRIVNDAYGYAVGDRLLKAVGERLSRSVRDYDTVAREEADRFTLVLPLLKDASLAGVVAESIRQALKRPFNIGGHPVDISCAFGIALYPLDGHDAPALLAAAALALAQAKQQGMDLPRFATPSMEEASQERLSVSEGLRRALERNELLLHFQPQVSLAEGRVVGVEALLRWNHPSRGVLPAGNFLDAAEQSGVMADIGTWVLREAARQARRWQLVGLDLPVAVNIGPAELDGSLPARVYQILEEMRLEPGRLRLEVNHPTLARRPEEAAIILGQLRSMGIRAAIDNFGTTACSLSEMAGLSVDTIKIDRSLAPSSPQEESAARMIVALGQSLGLKVVAEGIESKEQLELLQRLGCDRYQGFYYSPPLTPEEISRRLLP